MKVFRIISQIELPHRWSVVGFSVKPTFHNMYALLYPFGTKMAVTMESMVARQHMGCYKRR